MDGARAFRLPMPHELEVAARQGAQVQERQPEDLQELQGGPHQGAHPTLLGIHGRDAGGVRGRQEAGEPTPPYPIQDVPMLRRPRCAHAPAPTPVPSTTCSHFPVTMNFEPSYFFRAHSAHVHSHV